MQIVESRQAKTQDANNLTVSGPRNVYFYHWLVPGRRCAFQFKWVYTVGVVLVKHECQCPCLLDTVKLGRATLPRPIVDDGRHEAKHTDSGSARAAQTPS